MSQATLSKVLKGLYAGALAFAASLGVVLVGSEPVSAVTSGQWVVICGSTLAAFGGAFGLAGWSGPVMGANHNAHRAPTKPSGGK